VTHDDAFLADVLATPLDDAPRLIYADWLEDAGDPDRAEFVRVQCELAQTPAVLRAGTAVTGRDGGFLGLLEHDLPNPRHEDLRRRQRELVRANGLAWVKGLPGARHWSVEGRGDCFDARCAFRRGFVESVTLPADAFLEHAAALFAAAPLLEVTLADRSPLHRADLDAWLWFAGESWHWGPHRLREPAAPQVPLSLCQRLRGPEGWTNYFPTREGALAALSRACVVWGRERAGLPPLPVKPAPSPAEAPP
jgi:uncharacterized protein (TIGR02996 family)